jgi:hypothetical protein
MPEVALQAGTIAYQDSGGGPVGVLLRGLAMDGSLWLINAHARGCTRRRTGRRPLDGIKVQEVWT